MIIIEKYYNSTIEQWNDGIFLNIRGNAGELLYVENISERMKKETVKLIDYYA